MNPLYILGGFPYEAMPSHEHGVIFRLVKAARRKPSPGQMALFDMPSKPKAPKRNKPKEGDTRTNKKGNKEVLRSGRWRLLEPKAKASRPSGAGLSILSEDAISTTKRPLRLRPKPSSVAAGAWSDALKPKLPSPLALGDDDIFEPTPDAPLTDDIDYAYNQGEVDSRGNSMDLTWVQNAYDKALKSVDSPLSCSKVFPGVYLASDADGKIWEVSRVEEAPGKPWIAQSYPVSAKSEYTDYWPTKLDVLADLGFSKAKQSSMVFKKVEPGVYESDAHRIFQDQTTTYYTSGSKAMSRKDRDWVLVDKATGKVVRGIGTLKQAKQMAANPQN